MRTENKEYHDLEDEGDRAAEEGRHQEAKRYYNMAATGRTAWMDEYYRDDCRGCDSLCGEHQFAVNTLNAKDEQERQAMQELREIEKEKLLKLKRMPTFEELRDYVIKISPKLQAALAAREDQ